MDAIIAIVFIVLLAFYLSASAAKKNRIKFVENEKTKLVQSGFVVSKQVDCGNYCLILDDNKKKFCVIDDEKASIHNYNEIIKFELIQDNNIMTKGRSGSALVGGLFFGEIGAIAGASRSKKSVNKCFNLSIKIYLNNLNEPVILLNFIEHEIARDSESFQKICSLVDQFSACLNYIEDYNSKNKKD